MIDSAHEKVLRTLLTCVLEKMKYTDDYDFEDPGPEEDDFIALRKVKSTTREVKLRTNQPSRIYEPFLII